jgi:L-ascorbate metabolism protein UlaG (beta-lactamase superfamily)
MSKALGQVDVLMIPVGGQETISASRAVSIVEQIEPSLVIPMHYKVTGVKMKLDSVDKFLKEMGISQKKTVDKLTFKKKDLSGKEMEVSLMKI